MTRINDFKGLSARLASDGGRRRVAVVCPDDEHTRQVIERALSGGLADVALFGCGDEGRWAELLSARFGGRVSRFGAATPDGAAAAAAELVRRGGADVLMKGRINTDNLLRAVLDKERGLMAPGRVLTHIAAAEIPSYGKLLLFADAAVIPNPAAEQFEAIVGYGAEVCRSLGVEAPRVALINCSEKVSGKFPHTLSYQEVKRKAAEGRFGRVFVDGPMDVKTACDAESGRIKGLSSPVVGQADMLVFPDIQAGNTFYKTVTLFAGARVAGFLCGTAKPVVVTSRADSAESKYNSLALACCLMDGR